MQSKKIALHFLFNKLNTPNTHQNLVIESVKRLERYLAYFLILY